MSMGHAGERGFEIAADAGVFGAIGIVIGALLGWPRSGTQPLGSSGLVMHSWHNAFTSGLEFSSVVEAGLAGGGAIALGCALMGLVVHQARSSH